MACKYIHESTWLYTHSSLDSKNIYSFIYAFRRRIEIITKNKMQITKCGSPRLFILCFFRKFFFYIIKKSSDLENVSSVDFKSFSSREECTLEVNQRAYHGWSTTAERAIKSRDNR